MLHTEAAAEDLYHCSILPTIARPLVIDTLLIGTLLSIVVLSWLALRRGDEGQQITDHCLLLVLTHAWLCLDMGEGVLFLGWRRSVRGRMGRLRALDR